MRLPGTPAGRRTARLVLQWVFLAAAIALAVVVLVDQWDEVSDAIARIGAGRALLSLGAGMLAVVLSSEQQRALLAAWGHPQDRRPWARVFLSSQLGKYLPGTGWAYVAQMEFSKERGIGRGVSLVVIVTGAGLSVGAAAALAVLVAGSATEVVPPWLLWTATTLGLLGCAAVLVRPTLLGIVTAVLRGLPRMSGLPGAPAAGPTRAALGYTAASWLAFGVHLWAITGPLGLTGWRGFVIATGGFAVAWVCGFLVVVAPAGVGIREAVLVAVLGPAIGAAGALAAGVASRFLIVVGEVLLAVLALALDRRSPRAVEAPPSAGTPAPATEDRTS